MATDYPTYQGHYPSTIQDAALKQEFLVHGFCRPTGPYRYKDDNGKMVINFNQNYHHQFVNNIQVPRGWLCYSKELMKPYCEVCWLFADRSKQLFDQMEWVNGVSGSTADHIGSSAIFLKWKSGKTLNDGKKEMYIESHVFGTK